MPELKHIAKSTPYASCADFQQIFKDEMHGFYLLSLLLTADHQKAEQCFVSGLDDAVKGTPVFREWAASWARRAIIQSAVRAIKPRPGERSSDVNPAFVDKDVKSNGPSDSELRPEFGAVLGLEPFERFVYVMSILERYPDQDCSVLLGCARRDVVAARNRALQQAGNAMDPVGLKSLPNAGLEKPAIREHRGSLRQLLVGPRLATSA